MLASFLPALTKLIVAQPVSNKSLASAISWNPCCVVDVGHGVCPFKMVCHSNETRARRQDSSVQPLYRNQAWSTSPPLRDCESMVRQNISVNPLSSVEPEVEYFHRLYIRFGASKSCSSGPSGFYSTVCLAAGL
jgi:hypothetical protein